MYHDSISFIYYYLKMNMSYIFANLLLMIAFLSSSAKAGGEIIDLTN